jgi:cytochrome P450
MLMKSTDGGQPPCRDTLAVKHALSGIGAEFNPFYGAQLDDPYPFFARARRDEPVFYSELLKMWYVTRYDDIVAVVKDPDRFSSAEAVNVPVNYTGQQSVHGSAGR